MDEKLVFRLEIVLNNSDIVWPKYGTESVKDLAERIVRIVELIEKTSCDQSRAIRI